MKNSKILLITLATILLPVSGFGLYSLHTQSDNYTSRQYSEKVLKKVATSWNASDLIIRAHPDMIIRNTEAGITHFTTIFAQRLGRLKELKDCDGYATEVHYSKQPTRTTANYHCPARFEKGNGTINIGLMQNTKEEWKVFSFSVESPLLHKQ